MHSDSVAGSCEHTHKEGAAVANTSSVQQLLCCAAYLFHMAEKRTVTHKSTTSQRQGCSAQRYGLLQSSCCCGSHGLEIDVMVTFTNDTEHKQTALLLLVTLL
jgi:hypothetical protein